MGPPKYSELVSQGPEVGWLQSALKSLAYPVEVTDFYDKETYVAVRNYQLSARLPITGIADKKTRQALNKVLASPPKQVAPAAPQRGTRELHLSLVQTPEEIREVQMALQGLHIPVPISGVLDRELENAVRVFQTRQRLPVTGVVDARTRDKLRPFIRLTQVRSRIEKEVSELVSIFRQERGLSWDKWRLAHLRCTLENLAEGWLNPDRISDLDPEAPVPEPRKPDTASRDFLQSDLGSQGVPGVVFRGLEVQRLQEVLQEAGLEVNITALYDLQTFSAVKLYQQQHQLPPTGLVDAATREPVNAALVLRYEAEFARETLEAEIRVLETVLKAPEDPEQLGRLHQAIEDLLFGQQVALTQTLAPPGRGKLSDGPEIALLQELLEVPVTGQFDGPTAQALMRFQRQQRLPQSGWVDEPTREALNTLLNTYLEAP
jgi:peptidoglycan hydrolase-like protein with peptidoglycan-binding domain